MYEKIIKYRIKELNEIANNPMKSLARREEAVTKLVELKNIIRTKKLIEQEGEEYIENA